MSGETDWSCWMRSDSSFMVPADLETFMVCGLQCHVSYHSDGKTVSIHDADGEYVTEVEIEDDDEPMSPEDFMRVVDDCYRHALRIGSDIQRLRADGASSLKITATKAAREIDADIGDYVRIKLQKVDE